MTIDENDASPIERGKRLRYLRDDLLRLSRSRFGNLFNIPGGTIQTWEDARHGGLSEKGAKKIVQGLQDEGIDCRLEWLLFGFGEQPRSNFPWSAMNTSPKLESQSESTNEHSSVKAGIIQELQLFRQHYSNAIDTIVPDDAMMPSLFPGDYVAGDRYFDHDIIKTIGLPCIVQLMNGYTLVRIVEKEGKDGGHNLSCINPYPSDQPSILHDVTLFSAAPILWVRRQGFSQIENKPSKITLINS